MRWGEDAERRRRRMPDISRSICCVLAVVALLATVESSGAAPLKVCVVSLNEPHELDVFRSFLDQSKFQFIDIRAAAAAAQPPESAPGGAGSSSWLLNACVPETVCDLVVYSAEFAGRFFGKSGASLSLQEMEEASCQPRCMGLFRRPREVFLLACNTLATKDEDSRTPDEYLHVLLDHGFDRAAAERVVELRYGPLGPSFREALRRVFAGVPRIYGFSSVAPRGEYTAPMLARYLRGQGDYANALLSRTGDTAPNSALLASFKGTSLTQVSGLSSSEPGARDRDDICALYDNTHSVAHRLELAYALLSRPDALNFVPTLEVFLSRHPPEKLTATERPIFAQIQRLTSARTAVLGLVRQLNVSALKFELAHFAMLVGWIDRGEFHQLAVDGARQLFGQIWAHPITSETVDIMCEITKYEPLHNDFSADDFPVPLYDDADGLRLISCIAPSDHRITGRLLTALDHPDPSNRQWAAFALAQLLPLDEAVLRRLVPYVRDSSPEIAARVRWIFQAQGIMPDNGKRPAQTANPALARELAVAMATAGP
jgi:hypothetical protein